MIGGEDSRYVTSMERTLVVAVVAFLLALGSCIKLSVSHSATCEFAARNASLRDSVALNDGGCSLPINTRIERP